jgi:hypothetical protein
LGQKGATTEVVRLPSSPPRASGREEKGRRDDGTINNTTEITAFAESKMLSAKTPFPSAKGTWHSWADKSLFAESYLSTSSDQHQTFTNASTLSIISKGTKSMGQTP